MDCKKCDKIPPLLYLYVFKLMVDRIGLIDQIVTTKQLLEFWHRTIYNVPRKYDRHILDEMCMYGLIEKINSQKYMFYGNKNKNMLRRKLNDKFLWW